MTSANANIWDLYAQSFARITTHYQSEVYRHVAAMARGVVVDLGCGSAKLAPYLASNDAVTRYLGIDACSQMVEWGARIIQQLERAGFAVALTTIEDCAASGFAFAVSINSYYSWPDPLAVLARIHQMLAPGGDFVIATPNDRLDMPKLMRHSAEDFFLNPDFQQFRQFNDVLAGDKSHQFVSMDTLIGQLRSTGFQIQSCRTDFFEGGLNFVHTKAGGSAPPI